MAKISGNSLFMIQTGDSFYSIKVSELQTYLAPLAIQPLGSINRKATPGLMYPSEQFKYDQNTGELSLRGDDTVVKELYGFIGYVNNFPVDSELLDQFDIVLKPAQNGVEPVGSYYVVIDPEYKYITNDWGTAYYDPLNPGSGNYQRVFVGDELHKQPSGDWERKMNPLSSNVFMLKRLNAYPHISQLVYA